MGLGPIWHSGNYEQSFISSQQGITGKETPPKILSKVKDWLTDPNLGQLVLKKYQEVAIPRTKRTKHYKWKTRSPAKVDLAEGLRTELR